MVLFLEFEINMAEKTHKSAVVEDDVLSCNSEYDESELSNDLVVCNKKVKTARSDNVPAKPRIIRGTAIKRKSSGPKGGSKPKSVKKSGPAKASSMGDIDKLKSQFGLDVIVNSLSSLTGIVQNIQSIQKKSVSNTTCTNSAPKPSQTLTAARSTGPSATLSRPLLQMKLYMSLNALRLFLCQRIRTIIILMYIYLLLPLIIIIMMTSIWTF